ncbi:MAG: tetratricopeptide repeat protein [Vicinamibacterales bacterium]
MRRVLALLVAAAAWLAPGVPPASAAPAPVTLVMPFETPAGDDVDWLAEGSAVLLTDLVEGADGPVVHRDERLWAFDRLQLPPAAALSLATVIKVGQAVGATRIVTGRVARDGDGIVARARLVELDGGRMTPEVEARGPAPDLVGIYSRLAHALVPAAPLPGRAPRSARAVELYVRGLVADSPDEQEALLAQALEAGADDRARLALWDTRTDQGQSEAALEIVEAVGEQSRWSRPARYRAAMSLIALERLGAAFETLDQLYADAPSAVVANAMGVVQLRRGRGTAGTERPTYYFTRATELDPEDADYFFNLGYAYWMERDAAAAVHWLREAVRRDQADGDAHYVLGVALARTGADAEAAREQELAARLSSAYTAWDARAAAGLDPVPAGRERLVESLERPGARVASTITASGQRDQAELAAFHLDAGRRAFARENDRQAEAELRRALFLSPYLAEAHVLLGRLALRAGRPAEAVQALKIAIWSEETSEAQVVLAEAYLQVQEPAAALAAVDRALELDPSSVEAQALRSRIGPRPPPGGGERAKI